MTADELAQLSNTLFSITVALIGATAPFVRSDPGQYTVAAAVKKLVTGDTTARGVRGLDGLAGR